MTMRIVHAMFARHMGGIEFSFLRWTEALRSLGHEVVCVVDSQADVSSHLPSDTQQISVRQAFDWDPLAIWQLRRELRCLAPDMMITHGNRAGRLLHRANKNQTPHLSVLHRPRFKGLACYDAVACVLLPYAKGVCQKTKRLWLR